MQHIHQPLSPFLALLASAPLLAQQGSEERIASPTSEALLRRPLFVKAALGADTVIENDAGQYMGNVLDHVIDTRTGRIAYVVVRDPQAGGSRGRLVPYTELVWDPEKRGFVLAMGVDELDELPAFDPIEPAAPAAREREAPSPRQPVNHVIASRVLEGEVLAADGRRIGWTVELLIEPKKGTVAFVLAQGAPGEDPYVIPWPATTWNPVEGDATRGDLSIRVTGEALEDAPRLEGADPARLEQPEVLERIYAFYESESRRAQG